MDSLSLALQGTGFKALLVELKEQRDEYSMQLETADKPEDIYRAQGKIAAIDKIIDLPTTVQADLDIEEDTDDYED